MRNFLFCLWVAAFSTVPVLAEDDAPVAPSGVPSAAATAPASANAASSTQSATAEADAKSNQIVCKKQAPPTGSRLGARKVCMTAKEWQERTAASQKAISDMQQKALGIVPGN